MWYRFPNLVPMVFPPPEAREGGKKREPGNNFGD